jgi:hypothetical protein
MIGEAEVGGVFIPWLLIVALWAFAISLLLRVLFRRLRLYRFVWHAGLFDTATYVVLLWITAWITNPNTL